jgi:phosphoribosylanthranilate isomerase
MTRIKFCGVRSAEAVEAAVAAGASAIGFNFHPPSPRWLAVDEAAALARRVPPGVSRVALFVDQPAETVRTTAEAIEADTVQLHGSAEPELCVALAGLRVIVALPANDEAIARLAPLAEVADAVLLDAAAPGQHGGTGRLADWAAVVAAKEAYPGLPVLLAGGLTPHNVGDAIRCVRPYMVDVASGVESAPGVKDPALMRAFAAAVWRADR